MKKSKSKNRNKETEILIESEEWESGKRGSKSTAADDGTEAVLDEAMDLQMISIRLPSSVIEALKAKAKKEEGIGYQPYTRQLLIRSLQVEYGSQEGKLHDLEERLKSVEKAVFKKIAGRSLNGSAAGDIAPNCDAAKKSFEADVTSPPRMTP